MSNNEDWQEVKSANAHDFDEVPVVQGILVKTEENVGENNSMFYTLEKEDGSEIGVWGSTVIDSRFTTLKIGQEVKIEYKGKVKAKTGGREYKDYKIFKRPMKEVEDDMPFK